MLFVRATLFAPLTSVVGCARITELRDVSGGDGGGHAAVPFCIACGRVVLSRFRFLRAGRLNFAALS